MIRAYVTLNLSQGKDSRSGKREEGKRNFFPLKSSRLGEIPVVYIRVRMSQSSANRPSIMSCFLMHHKGIW